MCRYTIINRVELKNEKKNLLRRAEKHYIFINHTDSADKSFVDEVDIGLQI